MYPTFPYITVATIGLFVGFLALVCFSLLHGLANTLDCIALHLHRIAKALRAVHHKRSGEITERWVREIEG